MLILPKPAQGELAHGYWGRLSHINLFSSPEKAIRAFAKELGIEKHVSQKAFALAAAAGVTNREFIRQHTLLPYLLAPSYQAPEECIGYKRGARRGSAEPILQLAREEAYSCSECSRLQEQSLGYTFWLREHQIPGILWCPFHEIRLQAVSSHRLYEAVARTSCSEKLISDIGSTREQQTLRRFADISTGFLVRKHANHFHIRYQLLTEQLQDLLLSDEVANQFPAMWIARTLPAMEGKVMGRPVEAIDGYLAIQHPLTLAVALTVLHKTARSALASWFG